MTTAPARSTTDGMDYDDLKRACWHLAHSLLCLDGEEGVAARCSSLAVGFEADALNHLEFLLKFDRDPNMLTAAVRFLDSHLAIPPMASDPRWFAPAMAVLMELACPNGAGHASEFRLYREIRIGLADLEAGASSAAEESVN